MLAATIWLICLIFHVMRRKVRRLEHELDALNGREDPEAICRRIELLEKLIPLVKGYRSVAAFSFLGKKVSVAFEKRISQIFTDQRVPYSSWLGENVSSAIRQGLLPTERHRDAAKHAHALFDEFLTNATRLESELNIAFLANSQANLYAAQYEIGERSAAEHAHELYDKSLTIYRRLDYDMYVVQTAFSQAMLYNLQYHFGDLSAAEHAHVLFDEALATLRYLGRELEIAAIAMNQGQLYTTQYKAGKAGAAERAHALFHESRAILGQFEEEVEITSHTVVFQAGLYAYQYEAGQARAAERAQNLYDEALQLARQIGNEARIARILVGQAVLYSKQYGAGEAGAAERAHALFDEALAIHRRTEEDESIAGTTLNWANLYIKQYQAGAADVAERACALTDEALELCRQIGDEETIVAAAESRATLYRVQYEAGDASAAKHAHSLYNEALAFLQKTNFVFQWIETARNRLSLFEAEGRYHEAYKAVLEIFLVVRQRILAVPDRSSKNRLLTEITGLGMRGAAAAIRFQNMDGATRCLEEGRALELGTRLRELEATLPATEFSELDAMRQDLYRAEIAAENVRKLVSEFQIEIETTEKEADRMLLGYSRLGAVADLDKAEDAVAEAHRKLNSLKALLNLDDIAAPPPSPKQLRAALSDSVLVQAVATEDEGWLLLLAPHATGWQAIRCTGLTTHEVQSLANRYIAHVKQFENCETPDGNKHDRTSLAPVNSFSEALATDLLPEIWNMISGPVHQALGVAGFTAAEGAKNAPEVVLCLPAELSILPIAAACDPVSGRPFYEDYALRLVPSLGALLSSASRARRDTPPSAVTLFNPIDDLPLPMNPAADLFERDEFVELTGYQDQAKNSGVATWQGLRLSVARYPGYITYFGHSHWDKEDGENSGLLLAPPLDEEGRIPRLASGNIAFDLATPTRIRSLPLEHTRLVFSASCGGAGLGLAVAQDEMAGLPTAWLEAGAAGMISSLYSVYTGPAADVMRYTLEAHLNEGLDPVQALRQAQMKLAKAFELGLPSVQLPELPMDASRSQPKISPSGLGQEPSATFRSHFHPTAHVGAFVLFGQ